MAFVSHRHRDSNGCYIFSSRPRAAGFRADREPPAQRTHTTYGNIMYDRRVVRGSTFARHILPAPNPSETERQQGPRRRGRARVQQRSRTPEALQGRKHMDVQTELYLEELSDAAVAADRQCQTDAFLDRPATPLFIPAKSGKDAETQIEEGELFHFDTEVQPLLEVLVGKTVEQSLVEVMEEEELACLKAQQRAFEELRNNELAEVLRLQEQERRRSEEKRRRIAQHSETLKKERESAEKMAVRAFTQQYLAGLQPSVLCSLRSHGFFYDPVEKDVDSGFFPWLMAEVNSRVEKRHAAEELLDIIIQDVSQRRLDMSTGWRHSDEDEAAIVQ